MLSLKLPFFRRKPNGNFKKCENKKWNRMMGTRAESATNNKSSAIFSSSNFFTDFFSSVLSLHISAFSPHIKHYHFRTQFGLTVSFFVRFRCWYFYQLLISFFRSVLPAYSHRMQQNVEWLFHSLLYSYLPMWIFVFYALHAFSLLSHSMVMRGAMITIQYMCRTLLY